MSDLLEKLSQLISTKFEELELAHLFLVDMKQNGETIQVFLDSDSAVLFEHCVLVSRYLENHIEENKWMPEKYTIDVSSAGVGTPLKSVRQYKKNIGRTINVRVKDNHKHIEGELTKVGEEGIVVTYQEKVKIEGRKKKELITYNKEINYQDIEKTVVKISFN